MELDIKLRAKLVHRIRDCLRHSASASEVLLRGSLAEGCADQYSDIDLLWDVPDECFQSSVENIAYILAEAHPLGSIRSDPNFQHSRKRRLFFINFCDVPLFWRVDLDVFAKSVCRDPLSDVDNPAAQGAEWSLPHSALANVVAAVKWHLRGDEVQAEELLARAFVRLSVPEAAGDLRRRMMVLVTHAQRMDEGVVGFGNEVKKLIGEALSDAPF